MISEAITCTNFSHLQYLGDTKFISPLDAKFTAVHPPEHTRSRAQLLQSIPVADF